MDSIDLLGFITVLLLIRFDGSAHICVYISPSTSLSVD